jgi:hypothetical protein
LDDLNSLMAEIRNITEVDHVHRMSAAEIEAQRQSERF